MFDVRAILAVGTGAAIGGILRFLVTQAVVVRFGATSAQYATAFINVSGSFLIGVVIELAQTRADFSPLVRTFAATGILGGYTTFSTFSFEALSLAGGGFVWESLLYIAGSVLLGIGAAFAGVAAARSLVS
jgi:CrcB protein